MQLIFHPEWMLNLSVFTELHPSDLPLFAYESAYLRRLGAALEK